MSKQSEAKDRQHYEPRKEWPCCSRCEHYRSTYTNENGYNQESEIHCGPGGFVVKKQGWCIQFQERGER